MSKELDSKMFDPLAGRGACLFDLLRLGIVDCCYTNYGRLGRLRQVLRDHGRDHGPGARRQDRGQDDARQAAPEGQDGAGDLHPPRPQSPAHRRLPWLLRRHRLCLHRPRAVQAPRKISFLPKIELDHRFPLRF